MTLGPSAALIRAQVQAIRDKAHKEDPRVFGFKADGGWSGAPTLEIDGERFVVAPCRSSLEVREKGWKSDGPQPQRSARVRKSRRERLRYTSVTYCARRLPIAKRLSQFISVQGYTVASGPTVRKRPCAQHRSRVAYSRWTAAG